MMHKDSTVVSISNSFLDLMILLRFDKGENSLFGYDLSSDLLDSGVAMT
jgi:hypothetical protein